MTIDTQKRIGRRALLAVGAASLAAAAAEVVTAPARVAAADGDAIKIGQVNTGSTVTVLGSPTAPVFQAQSGGSDALIGWSAAPAKSGLYAHSSSAGGHGVYGKNDVSGTWGFLGGPDDAVHGECTGSGQTAIRGVANSPACLAVDGSNQANLTAGILGGTYGVIAIGMQKDGLGLGVYGKAAFSRSGILTIPANKSSITHSGIALADGCMVLAALQQYRGGVYVAAAVPNIAADSITIRLNKKVSAATKVAWFVIDRVLPD